MRNASNAFTLVILLTISTYIFKKMLRIFPQSKILNNIVSIATQLKLSWDNLLTQSICQTPYKFNVDTGILPGPDVSGLGVRIFGGESEAAEPVECAVCLCKIEEGEEVGDLRCDHIFHRACLDRWLGTGHMTCPLCRSHVKPASRYFEELHREVIVFNSFSDRRDRCTWWLR